jgi:hypothetical protein
MVSLALSMLRMSRYGEALSKIAGRGWPKARNVIDTQEQAAISKSGEALLLLPLHFQICL